MSLQKYMQTKIKRSDKITKLLHHFIPLTTLEFHSKIKYKRFDQINRA